MTVELYHPCVHCGYCCLRSICALGIPDSTGKCLFLYEKEGRYYCEFYKEPNDPDEFPYFGAGCCSYLNTRRRDIIKRINENEFAAIDIRT